MDSAKAAHQAFLRTKTFGALDGLRALAILAVVLYHVLEAREGLVGRFYLSVSLFFAISGFLITTLLLRERDTTGTISLKGFYARRSLRIFPLYYAVCALYIVLVFFLEHDVAVRGAFFDNVRYYLTYTSNWFIKLDEGRIIFYFAWSMATEEQFYLMWPFVVRYFKGTWGPVVFMSGLLALGLFAGWGVSSGFLDTRHLWVRILSSISISICMGCLSAYLTHFERPFVWTWKVLGQVWSAPVLVALVTAAVWNHDTPLWLSSLLLTLMVVAMCIRPHHVFAPLVDHKWLRYMGSITYGIYLLHMISLNIVRRVVPHNLALYYVLTIALSMVLATISFRYFEKPFLKLKNRFDWRDQKKPQPAVVPPVANTPANPG
ncbi:acyltransferase family protein [Melittangium boletus]|uniref:Acyltransferase n=1 Tax=Melittangium boletus DSM 14713 TaxID=1294270 RepID=A0A250IFM4_9BACT|nr:acyltransferase [Melittangium boletus]ATB30033.1 acyltransferase [Melittangium boletus DSM 14713]